MDDRQLASRTSARFAAQLAEATVRTRRTDIPLCGSVKVPDVTGVIRVCERLFSFDASSGGRQMSMQISGPIGDVTCLASPSESRLVPEIVVGQVCGLPTDNNRPLVKVNFPWQKRTADPKSWEGVWCEVPQPSGGANKTSHGVLILPDAKDWVRVFIDPSSVVPPVVLGAVPPIGGVFGREWDAARDRLLLVTEAGHWTRCRNRSRCLLRKGASS